MLQKIFFSNIGYARGIDGSLWQHISRAHRHLYCPIPHQDQALAQLKNIVEVEKPDLCCFVEIDNGSFHSAYYNQLKSLVNEEYHFFDIADKYGDNSNLGKMPLFNGKSNAFMARRQLDFEKLYFNYGSKRLIYKMMLPDNILLFFTHFALQQKTRARQFAEIRAHIDKHDGEVIVLGDFNIMSGFKELTPLLNGTDLKVLNTEDGYTFTFHKFQRVLDLCICSETLVDKVNLRIIPQSFSDHAGLMLEAKSGT